MRLNPVPSIFLSPSTQEWNAYVDGGTEEQYMNEIADRMEPYLRASGIVYRRNDPTRGAAGAIADSNAGTFDVHLALHSNAAPESLSGKLRGIDIYYSPASTDSELLATVIANNFKFLYPIPDKSTPRPTTSLGEVTQTKATAVLCEIGYHDNPEDAAWIRNNLNAIAMNLVESLCDDFGIPFVYAGPIRTGTVFAGGSNLNIRGYPSTSGRIIGSIPDGASVIVYGKTDNWYVIFYQGITGYVSGDFLSVDT
jgi:N-acetylmuramoyl-L-alanine amidase